MDADIRGAHRLVLAQGAVADLLPHIELVQRDLHCTQMKKGTIRMQVRAVVCDCGKSEPLFPNVVASSRSLSSKIRAFCALSIRFTISLNWGRFSGSGCQQSLIKSALRHQSTFTVGR